MIAPTVRAYGADLKIKDLLEFVDFHHNLMIFANSESRKTVRELANEFGVDFEDYGYTMQGGKAPKDTAQAAFKQNNVTWSSSLFEPLHRVFTPLERPVLVEDGIGALLDSPKNNRHVFPILRADPGSYSFNQGATERSQTSGVSGN